MQNVVRILKEHIGRFRLHHLTLLGYDSSEDNGWVEVIVNMVFNIIRKLHPLVIYNKWLLKNGRKTRSSVDTYVMLKLALSLLTLFYFSRSSFINQLWMLENIIYWVISYDILYTIIYNIDNLLFSFRRHEQFSEMRIVQSLKRSFILAVVNVITLVAQFGILYYLYAYQNGVYTNVTWSEMYQSSFYCMLTFNTDAILKHYAEFNDIIFFQVVAGLVFLTIIIGRILGLLPEGTVRGRGNT